MPSEVRITDQHILKIIETEQKATGEKTATRTASRLILERIAIRDSGGRQEPRREPEPQTAPAA